MSAPGKLRIVGGAWKRTPIPVLDLPGLRPTPERVRETLFNWLGQDLSGWRVLDLFAGSGALALEAASRGAAEVLAVDSAPSVVKSVRAIGTKLGARTLAVEQGDAVAVAARLAAQRPGAFDLVMLDPPFGKGWLERLAAPVAQLVAPGGWVYLESEAAVAEAADDPWRQAGFAPWRAGRAGQVRYHLLQRQDPDNHNENQEGGTGP